jgi:hypothetical protein
MNERGLPYFLSWRHRDSLIRAPQEPTLQRYRYIHKKFNPPVTSRWVYDRATASHSGEREGYASKHGKKSIHVCFHSLQKSCLLRVARYIVQPVTCFVGCNNFPCSNRRESRALVSYHSSMAFLCFQIYLRVAWSMFLASLWHPALKTEWK